MVTIHTAGDGHTAPSPDADGTNWSPYPATGTARKRLDAALRILRNNVKGLRPCNACFTALSGGTGRTFDAILADPTIFLSLDTGGPDLGATSGSDITINMKGNANEWQVAATIVHEFAHINGVPGGGHGVAENLVRCCGLKGAVRRGTD